MAALETLKLKHGKFVLSEVSSPRLRLKLSKNAHWESIGNDAYTTTSLGAAVEFKQYATGGMKKIFSNILQEHYCTPKIPSLPLDPHQEEGIKWILSRKRSYLAHAPGAGKTCEAIIASCISEKPGTSVYIVPPSLALNWEREILKFTEWLDIWPAIGRVKQSDTQDEVAWNADFLIIPDSMLTKDWVYTRLQNLKIKLLAVDEASRFKEPYAERSLAFYGGKDGEKVYPGIFRNAKHVVFLDGSPMPNRPMEIWGPTYALHPEAIDCMGQDDFGYRYCGAKPNQFGVWEYKYSSNEKELNGKLTKDFMHVVKEEELSHPERRRSMVFMDEDVRTSQQKTWERRHLKEVPLSDAVSQGDLARFRKELGLKKVPWIARYVRERIKEKNESILLFVWHREVAGKLYSALESFNPGFAIGGTPPAQRERDFNRFQNGVIKLLILNIAAGGRGFNLQRADRVIFGEFSWTDETNKQAEKRASRKGSDKEFVRCEYIVCPNSIDEIVLKSVFAKETRIRKIIG